jgi:hypothetical protein
LTTIIFPAPFAGFSGVFPKACIEMELAARAALIAKISRLLPAAIRIPIYLFGVALFLALPRGATLFAAPALQP